MSHYLDALATAVRGSRGGIRLYVVWPLASVAATAAYLVTAGAEVAVASRGTDES